MSLKKVQLVGDHKGDPAKELLEKFAGIKIDARAKMNRILVAYYVRPEKTKSGIILTDNFRKEDEYQGKVGLVVAMGPSAYADANMFAPEDKVSVGDWVMFRPSAGLDCQIRGHKCKLLFEGDIEMDMSSPDVVY